MKRMLTVILGCVILIGLVPVIQAECDAAGPPIWNQDKDASDIKELTIRNSGFRSKATVVIRYRDEDKKIVEVLENGIHLTPSEFSRYESILHDVLELPRINELMPEIEEAHRRLDSSHISGEARLDYVRQLLRNLEEMESTTARRHRTATELRLIEAYDRAINRISESKEMNREEKVKKLKEVMGQMREMEQAGVMEGRLTALTEYKAAEAARRAMEELNHATEMTRREKIREMSEIARQMREINSVRHEEGPRHRDLVELETVQILRNMLEEINHNKELSDEEKAKEINELKEEFEKEGEISERISLMIRVAEFELALERFLNAEGLIPASEAEFVLTSKGCSIAGKKVSGEVYGKILRLYKETMREDVREGLKIVLHLNEKVS